MGLCCSNAAVLHDGTPPFGPNSAPVQGSASRSRAPGSVAAKPRAPSLDSWHQRMPLLLSVVLCVYKRYVDSSMPSICRMRARADGARRDKRTWQQPRTGPWLRLRWRPVAAGKQACCCCCCCQSAAADPQLRRTRCQSAKACGARRALVHCSSRPRAVESAHAAGAWRGVQGLHAPEPCDAAHLPDSGGPGSGRAAAGRRTSQSDGRNAETFWPGAGGSWVAISFHGLNTMLWFTKPAWNTVTCAARACCLAGLTG